MILHKTLIYLYLFLNKNLFYFWIKYLISAVSNYNFL